MEEKEIKTCNLDEVIKKAKIPRFLFDEVHLDGTGILLEKKETRNLQAAEGCESSLDEVKNKQRRV